MNITSCLVNVRKNELTYRKKNLQTMINLLLYTSHITRSRALALDDVHKSLVNPIRTKGKCTTTMQWIACSYQQETLFSILWDQFLCEILMCSCYSARFLLVNLYMNIEPFLLLCLVPWWRLLVAIFFRLFWCTSPLNFVTAATTTFCWWDCCVQGIYLISLFKKVINLQSKRKVQ